MTACAWNRRCSPGHRSVALWVAGFSALAPITGCATRTHNTYNARAASRDASVVSVIPDPHFTYQSETIEADTRVIDRDRHYEIRRLSFPSIGDNGQAGNLVTAEYHRSLVLGRRPVVVVLPIWGRHVYPSNAVTRTLRKRSAGALHVLNVLGEGDLIDWSTLGVATDEEEFMELWVQGATREITTVIDIRRLLDWAEAQPEIDSHRIGLIGFSHGAMLAPVILTQEPRFSAAVLVMGGADAHEVIARCIGARTEGVQIHAEQTFGWSSDEMAAILEPIYSPLNSAGFPGRVDPSRVLIFDAGKDECVPKGSRDALWEAMGRPERITINATHRHAFYTMTPLNLNWMRKQIWKFFETRLLEDPAHFNSDRRKGWGSPSVGQN